MMVVVHNEEDEDKDVQNYVEIIYWESTYLPQEHALLLPGLQYLQMTSNVRKIVSFLPG